MTETATALLLRKHKERFFLEHNVSLVVLFAVWYVFFRTHLSGLSLGSPVCFWEDPTTKAYYDLEAVSTGPVLSFGPSAAVS